MVIIAQKLSPEASSKYDLLFSATPPTRYFSSPTLYVFTDDLSEAELAEMYSVTMDGSKDIQMSTVSYSTNPYNSDSQFPYQNQTNEIISPVFQDASGSSIKPKKPLTYKLKS